MIILEKRTFPERKEKETSNRVIANRIDIDQRLSIVNEKIRFGDLEIDTVIGKNHKGALLSINEGLQAWYGFAY